MEEVEAEVRPGDTADISVPVPPHLGAAAHHPYSLEVVGEHLYRLEAKIFHEIISLRPWRPGHFLPGPRHSSLRLNSDLWDELDSLKSLETALVIVETDLSSFNISSRR